ncbi:MAG: hypothetical protein V7K32_23730 [Nostoc sp.]|uniref:hypothetical protein n=1 Tax=Nostoc sp. TaxID=1180 RepID=UPI002FF5FE86
MSIKAVALILHNLELFLVPFGFEVKSNKNNDFWIEGERVKVDKPDSPYHRIDAVIAKTTSDVWVRESFSLTSLVIN